jgi:hypothetical protein
MEIFTVILDPEPDPDPILISDPEPAPLRQIISDPGEPGSGSQHFPPPPSSYRRWYPPPPPSWYAKMYSVCIYLTLLIQIYSPFIFCVSLLFP